VATALHRIGLLGDMHAEDASLSLALRVFADLSVDRVMAVGDIVDGLGSVDRCCALLAEAGAAVVRGNHERWFLAGTMRDLRDATLTVGAEAPGFLAALRATRRVGLRVVSRRWGASLRRGKRAEISRNDILPPGAGKAGASGYGRSMAGRS
jgi:hypothetical protein